MIGTIAKKDISSVILLNVLQIGEKMKINLFNAKKWKYLLFVALIFSLSLCLSACKTTQTTQLGNSDYQMSFPKKLNAMKRVHKMIG